MNEKCFEETCSWASRSSRMKAYHDKEWGRPMHNDVALFGLFILETFQAGLSWSIILEKREHLSRAFLAFDPSRMKDLSDHDVESMLENPQIIRNRRKIQAAIQNANAFTRIMESGKSFADVVWSFRPKAHTPPATSREIPDETEESRRMSQDFKRMGFAFAGPVTCYSFMQGAGLVNDHVARCPIGMEINWAGMREQ